MNVCIFLFLFFGRSSSALPTSGQTLGWKLVAEPLSHYLKMESCGLLILTISFYLVRRHMRWKVRMSLSCEFIPKHVPFALFSNRCCDCVNIHSRMDILTLTMSVLPPSTVLVFFLAQIFSLGNCSIGNMPARTAAADIEIVRYARIILSVQSLWTASNFCAKYLLCRARKCKFALRLYCI